MEQHDDDLFFLDNEDEVSGIAPAWRILIVDDEPEVHATTIFALGRLQILGHGLEFLHAYSAEEARRILESDKNVAVILLDVVMERENAGLMLVREIRNELLLSDVRIILRTGQTGYAPEIEAIRDYDINDYKNKSELTRTKLFTALTAAIRAYEQLQTVSASRRGLERIILGSAELIALNGLGAFADGVIKQLSGMLGAEADGLVCTQAADSISENPENLQILAASGRFSGLAEQPLRLIDEAEIRRLIHRCLAERITIYQGGHAAILLGNRAGRGVVAYLALPGEPSALDKSLLDVFCTNISVCLDNIGLFERLRAFAYFDPILGLPNRVSLVSELDRLLASGEARDLVLALIDIDHFSETNDALGHAYGDQLLKVVALRLAGLRNEWATVARVAGDVFAVLGSGQVANPENIRALFSQPFAVDGNQQVVSASMGFIHLADVDGGGADALKGASIALKRAKSGDRGGYCLYERAMGTEVRERVRLLHDLRLAFARESLFLNYQPQVNLKTGNVIGAEALIRWKTDDGAFVHPERFISLAEYSGLIVGIGEWVLRTACFEQMRLEKLGFKGFRMAVNVTAVQFRHPRFLEMLDAAIADTGISPANLELEITESVAMVEMAHMVSLFNVIKTRGVTVAIDDFGTGFSSLSYLQQLSVDRLKIDRAFVNQMTTPTAGGHSIAQMVIELGRNLGLTVIAEGVEDAAQASSLVALGCHEGQGFLFAKPMLSSDLSTWLAAHPMHVAVE